MIKAMMLFGSAARGDASETSDTDILCVTDSGKPHGIKRDVLEVQFMPEEKLLAMARQGDLFAIHLALEGKIIFDSTHIFSRFKEALTVKRDYQEEIRRASDFAWFLYLLGRDFDNTALVNKRIAWSTRTILISKLAEDGRFIFSPSGLASKFPNRDVKALLNLRRSALNSEIRFKQLHRFLGEHGNKMPAEKNLSGFKEYFDATGNRVALSTIDVLTGRKKRSVDNPY